MSNVLNRKKKDRRVRRRIGREVERHLRSRGLTEGAADAVGRWVECKGQNVDKEITAERAHAVIAVTEGWARPFDPTPEERAQVCSLAGYVLPPPKPPKLSPLKLNEAMAKLITGSGTITAEEARELLGLEPLKLHVRANVGDKVTFIVDEMRITDD